MAVEAAYRGRGHRPSLIEAAIDLTRSHGPLDADRSRRLLPTSATCASTSAPASGCARSSETRSCRSSVPRRDDHRRDPACATASGSIDLDPVRVMTAHSRSRRASDAAGSRHAGAERRRAVPPRGYETLLAAWEAVRATPHPVRRYTASRVSADCCVSQRARAWRLQQRAAGPRPHRRERAGAISAMEAAYEAAGRHALRRVGARERRGDAVRPRATRLHARRGDARDGHDARRHPCAPA